MRGEQKRACMAQLHNLFGLEDFRPGQKKAVSCLLQGRDLLCILPTGAGKSLCWQLPAIMTKRLTVVVSPLLALMHDQVRHLQERGIAAVSLDSLMTLEERSEALQAIREGRVRIVFVSPERLETWMFRQLCRECPPWLLVVDEAHCVVQWGEEFRPCYQRIGSFMEALEIRPVVCAMTATADAGMQKDIIRSLGMERAKRVILPVLRENLRYHVHSTTNRTAAIEHIAARVKGKTVIFCRSRMRAEQLAASLRCAGFQAEHYHAGLDRQSRSMAEERFRDGQSAILTATTAFGMGVDIPDIRCVIHDRLPDSVIDLAQQSGRAGRDGKPADCYVLVDPADLLQRCIRLGMLRRGMRWKPVRRMQVMRKSWNPLRTLLQVCLVKRCVAAGMASAFGQHAKRCGQCSACTQGPLARHVPDLPAKSAEQRRFWLLKWHRDALARKKGVPAKSMMSGEMLRYAAERAILPSIDDEEVRMKMERLLDAVRRAETGDLK